MKYKPNFGKEKWKKDIGGNDQVGDSLGRKKKNRGQVWRTSSSGIWLEGKVG